MVYFICTIPICLTVSNAMAVSRSRRPEPYPDVHSARTLKRNHAAAVAGFFIVAVIASWYVFVRRMWVNGTTFFKKKNRSRLIWEPTILSHRALLNTCPLTNLSELCFFTCFSPASFGAEVRILANQVAMTTRTRARLPPLLLPAQATQRIVSEELPSA